MHRVKTRLLLLLITIASCGCASKEPASPPPPAAWAMLPASNSLEVLDETFLLSEPESSKTVVK